jgi:hypothetical protein
MLCTALIDDVAFENGIQFAVWIKKKKQAQQFQLERRVDELAVVVAATGIPRCEIM